VAPVVPAFASEGYDRHFYLAKHEYCPVWMWALVLYLVAITKTGAQPWAAAQVVTDISVLF